jgi:acetolactate synthase-1/2/3 large subunit
MWLARYAGFRDPNQHVSSGGLGTMGFSVPAAMGAALGRPDRETWAITGDGGFQMTFQELMTLVQDDIPVKIALFDNKKLGMIRQWQEIIYAGNYHSAHLRGPDYLKLAEAFGIPATKAATPAEVDEAIRFAQGVDGPALIWFEIAEEQNVFPMMPAGKGLSDLIENWGGADECVIHRRMARSQPPNPAPCRRITSTARHRPVRSPAVARLDGTSSSRSSATSPAY